MHTLAELVRALRAGGSVFAEDEAALLSEAAAGDAGRLATLLKQRLSGQPLESLLGWAEFAGLRILIDPGVFVPRRRTEFLAELAIAACRPGSTVLDLCCGSGAISAAILHARPQVRLYASDLMPASLRCAARNIGGRAKLFQGDLFAALPQALRGHIDVLAVNAPYVPSDAIALMPPEARLHEPHSALDGGPDGLNFHRRVARDAAGWLRPRARIVIETSAEQAPTSAAIFETAGFRTRVASDDSRGATVILASREDQATS
ncbi:putative protein N(5)-glutamine methyltransferase [Microterricola viridarii]|uniref:peptide chain release factor N(5)-glutamine methyltransferase n=1 Tax=Microterricola viridarii TaxID=412690 RepID=A0A109QWR7_9MICO|nr:putative protein N(5)-glutamine methyltransferase [Microterricola viridarii]AMB58592.1 hypothetical protein AWU67_06655 [Microterricola viridarii]